MAYMNRAICYSDTGRYDLAIVDCSKVIELEPNFTANYFNRAAAYKELDKKTQAIADFEKCITLTSNPQLIEMTKKHFQELSQ